MLFPTTDFAIFFAIAFTVNWLLNPYSGWWKLSMIGLSYVFYGWVGWSYCLLLLLTTSVTYVGGAWVHASSTERGRRIAMGVSVAALLGILGWFKYYGFVSVNLDNLTHALGFGAAVPLPQVALPIAISFFTFMAISYVVDIYRRQLEPARPLDFAFYISFFPHLLAGPIVRGTELLPQIRRRRDANSIDYSRAFWLILAGLFKKVVISSYVSSAIVTPVFTSPTQHSAPEAIFAAWGYAVQIYCDFSGYTDIAIGIAMLLGFRFPQNFDAPYTARNLQDFWRRWHMTLSRWLRDYLYIPLGGSANGQAQTVRNIMITMVLGGLWHGAAWTFVVWGTLQGLGPALLHLPVRLPGLGVLQRHRHVAGLFGHRPPLQRLGPGLPADHAAPRHHHRGHPRLPVRAPVARGPPAGGVLPAADRRAGRPARLRAARHHHVRSGGRRALYLLPVLMSDAPVPPHHVDWEPESEFQSHAHAELPPGEDERVRAPWRHVLMLGVAAFAVWFLLYAPTLQHNAQVSPVGPRRTVSLDVTGPVAAVSRALQLSHIVSVTGRGNGVADGGPGGGLTVAGPRPGRQPAGGWRRKSGPTPTQGGTAPTTPTTVPPNPKEPTGANPLRVLIVGDSIGID